MDDLQTKLLVYYQRLVFAGLELYSNYKLQVNAPNMDHSLLLINHIVHTFMHIWKSENHVRMFYLLKEFSIVGDVYFLGWSSM